MSGSNNKSSVNIGGNVSDSTVAAGNITKEEKSKFKPPETLGELLSFVGTAILAFVKKLI